MEKKLSVLKAQNLHKKFIHPTAHTVLKGVSLELFKGTSTAIMGRSGEGKSTLLNILGTLEPPNEGELFIGGQKVSFFNTSAIRRKHIGFVFQSFHLLEDFTVLENILMPARIARTPIHSGSEAHAQALSLLEKVGLSERAHFTTKLLSGGEKQRVALARALCNNPDIIFADEPTGNLDRFTAQGIHDLLIHFVKEQGKTLVVVTHNDELAEVCDQRFQLAEGHLVQQL